MFRGCASDAVPGLGGSDKVLTEKWKDLIMRRFFFAAVNLVACF